MDNKYDIFISYRRDNGEDKARILNQFLSTVGYRVFFDHESGMTGEFETEILAAVEIAPVFLMLLTPHCLDRCNDEGDWVRRELERATVFGKDIIPIRPNYDDSMFKNLPEGIPEYVLRLSKLEFAEIDFHKNFKATASNMVEEQIKKVVQPSIAIADTGNKGAKIHFFSDISCRVLHFGTPIAVTDATDKSVGAIARLLKGDHRLEYKSIEHEADAYTQIYSVPDNDYESFVNIELQPLKDKRKKKEEELIAEEERKAAEEKARRERIVINENNSQYKYDLFFCYSRQDASIVRQAYHFLTSAGYRCWMDMDGLAFGDNFVEQITDAVRSSKCMLYFGSSYSNKSKWTVKELLYALKIGIKILPLKLDDAPYPPEIMFAIGNINWFESDLRSREDMEKLLDVLSKLLDD